MVMNDAWIRHMAERRRMIEPFEPRLISGGVVSFGVSSYGYDARLADEFRVPEAAPGGEIDPKAADSVRFREITLSKLAIPPGSFALARTVEYFRIPRDILGVCLGKSTYARCGIVVNITPLEPEWEGYVTVSLVNAGRFPVKIHAGEGVAQVVFLKGNEPCGVSYADRRGKYQKQSGIRHATV
ncbi:MAG: dCTP deaminase [bacterium]